MAACSVTGGTSVRWIILPNSRDKEDWRQAINAAIEANPLLDVSDFIMTEHVGDAIEQGAAPDRIAAVISAIGPGDPLLLANPETRHAEVGVSTHPASELIRVRADRVFGPTSVKTGTVELFSDLIVAVPRTMGSTPFEEALAFALESFGTERRSATWRRELFSYPKPPIADEPPYTFDLSGRPKFVIFGPYLTMPPGLWTARFELTFDASSTRHRYRADWGGVTEYQSVEFRPERAGVYQIELAHEWTEAAPCELRLLSMEGVFEGQVTFSGAEIELTEAR